MGTSTPTEAPTSMLQIIAAIITKAMAKECEIAQANSAATRLPHSPPSA